MFYRYLNGDQARQTINVEQALSAYSAARDMHDRRYAGSIAWKTVSERQYLYRKRRGVWSSLGPRSAETETIHRQFLVGRTESRLRLHGLTNRLDELAPISRALGMGRVPVIAARILRQLNQAKLTGGAITVVGTNALFAYERLAGAHITSAHLTTDDIDLLFDARARLKLLAPDIAETGVAGLLKKVDRSFDVMVKGGFRAVNRDGYMVDLIASAPKDIRKPRPRSRIGTDESDLQAVEIEVLAWLVNSPKITVTVIDQRGYPVEMTAPDPRAFALHKAWLAKRVDRDPLKRSRDAGQAEVVAALVTSRLPHLRFDAPALGALPLALRNEAAALMLSASGAPRDQGSLTPDW